MQSSTLAIAAFVVGVVGNSVKALPQFVRTAVHGKVAGLAPTAVWLACTANVLWLCFGLSISDERFIVLMSAATALTGATLVRFISKTGRRTNARRAAIFMPACVLFVFAAAAGQSLALETLGTGLGIVISLPQLLHLWRSRRTPIDVSGVSQGEYKVVIAAQVGWTVYWLTQGHPVAALGAAWAGSARVVTLTLLWSHARRMGPTSQPRDTTSTN